MMPRDDALPPVPPDAADGSVISTSQLPWAAIPRFQPGVTNVREYVKKLEFLAAMWPVEYLDLLAPRAALLVEGSAFAAISKLDAQKLKVKSLDGIKTLVNANARCTAPSKSRTSPMTASLPEWKLCSQSC